MREEVKKSIKRDMGDKDLVIAYYLAKFSRYGRDNLCPDYSLTPDKSILDMSSFQLCYQDQIVPGLSGSFYNYYTNCSGDPARVDCFNPTMFNLPGSAVG